MARKKKRTKLPAGVKRLRDQIERWRRTRAKRTLMPAELWSEAIVQARREGAYLVAQAARRGPPRGRPVHLSQWGRT